MKKIIFRTFLGKGLVSVAFLKNVQASQAAVNPCSKQIFCLSYSQCEVIASTFLTVFCRPNMLEEKHEQHPDFFKLHRKNFRYLVLKKKPRIGFDIPSGSNYALGVHSSTSDFFCGFEKQPHYNVLFQCDFNIRKGYNIPPVSIQLFVYVGGLFESRHAR